MARTGAPEQPLCYVPHWVDFCGHWSPRCGSGTEVHIQVTLGGTEAQHAVTAKARHPLSPSALIATWGNEASHSLIWGLGLTRSATATGQTQEQFRFHCNYFSSLLLKKRVT